MEPETPATRDERVAQKTRTAFAQMPYFTVSEAAPDGQHKGGDAFAAAQAFLDAIDKARKSGDPHAIRSLGSVAVHHFKEAVAEIPTLVNKMQGIRSAALAAVHAEDQAEADRVAAEAKAKQDSVDAETARKARYEEMLALQAEFGTKA